MSVARRLALWGRIGLFAMVTATRYANAATPDTARLQAALGLANAPHCALCHESSDAGADLSLFGQALVAHGFVDTEPDSLETAITAMRKDDVDSDGDGATDLDEVSWGGDPNHADLPQIRPHRPRATDAR